MRKIFSKFICCFMLFLVASYPSNAQEIVRTDELSLAKGGQSLIVDESNPKIVVFDKESTHFIPINAKDEMSTYDIKGLDKKDIVGYSKTDDSTFTFYIEKKNRYIDYQLIRTNKNTQRYGRVNHKLPAEEEVISRFSAMNDFYILTLTNNSSTLNFYSYNAVYFKERWSIDLSNSEEFKNVSLYEAFQRKISQKGAIISGLFGNKIIHVGNSLELKKLESINTSKIFFDKSNLYITLDSNNKSTVLITISLKDKNHSIQKIDYPGFCASPIKNTNSFIADGLIFSVRYCFDAIALKVSTLEGEELIAWAINSKFKSWNNTTLYGDEYFVNRTMDNIINTISEGYAGFVANKVGDDIMLSFGGQKPVEITEIKPGVKAYSEGWLLFPLSFEALAPKQPNSKFLYDDYFRYINEIEASSFQRTFSVGDTLFFANYDTEKGQFKIVKFE